jgi:hypothetical protein
MLADFQPDALRRFDTETFLRSTEAMSQAMAHGNVVVPVRQSQVFDQKIDRRIQTHPARIAAAFPDVPNLAGAGDSWFKYPLAPGSPSDIPAVLSEWVMAG